MIEIIALFLAWISDKERSELLEQTEIGVGIDPAREAFDQAYEYIADYDLGVDDIENFDERMQAIEEIIEENIRWVGLEMDDPVLYIGGVELPEEARQRGYGRAIVQGIEAWAYEQGARVSVLYATDIGPPRHPTEIRVSSQGFWEKMGYDLSVPASWGGGVMVKYLKPPKQR